MDAPENILEEVPLWMAKSDHNSFCISSSPLPSSRARNSHFITSLRSWWWDGWGKRRVIRGRDRRVRMRRGGIEAKHISGGHGRGRSHWRERCLGAIKRWVVPVSFLWFSSSIAISILFSLSQILAKILIHVTLQWILVFVIFIKFQRTLTTHFCLSFKSKPAKESILSLNCTPEFGKSHACMQWWLQRDFQWGLRNQIKNENIEWEISSREE